MRSKPATVVVAQVTFRNGVPVCIELTPEDYEQVSSECDLIQGKSGYGLLHVPIQIYPVKNEN